MVVATLPGRDSKSSPSSLVDYLEYWADAQPDKTLYTFLDVEGRERDTYTYLAFHERTRRVAEVLHRDAGLKRGDRALLVYPPGLEVIVAFVACSRIGVIPVPVYPPTPMNFEGGLAKLAFIANDCDAKAALTTRGFLRSYRLLLAKRRISALWRSAPGLPKLEWVTTDDVRGQASNGFVDDPDPTLFLQYTSGSTSDPKGVVVSHENVVHNGFAVLDHSPTTTSWLPQYHDMGLIGYYLYPLLWGGANHGFSPLDFLKRPSLWLRTASRVRATYLSAPNFGYEYCLREDKVTDADLEGVDLSSVRVMMNASEPVRAETCERFFARFEPYGLRREAFVVAYGLAENTLAVSHYGRAVVTVNKRLLQQRRLRFEPPYPRDGNRARLVSCGRPLEGIHVRIVDPETRHTLRDEEIGEIWISGKSTCAGYWRRPELSAEHFGATIDDATGETRGFLRTGDLGFFHEGELYVCGRIKDLIIIRGVNYYPQDIEAIVEGSSPKIRKGGVAAFDVDEDGEALVVVVEVRRREDLPNAAEIARAIRTQYYVEPRIIAFVAPRSIQKTTSGKLARQATKLRWVEGTLETIAVHVSSRDPLPSGDESAIRERFRYIVELYNLTGREEYPFTEIGIDSLTLVELIEDIKVLLEEHGAAQLVKDVDVKLLQRLTIAEFFAMLDRFEKASDEPIAALRAVLKRVQREHEEYERECMSADAILEPLGGLEAVSPAPEFRNVLLTGATGFFGPFLLASLLKRTPWTYHVLMRATDPVHGMDRLRASLRRSRLATPELDADLESRVRVVCGDLAQHNLGLRAEQWKSLTAKVQAVLHNGARVNYVQSYDALRPHNVDGTRELIRFAATGRPKAFDLVSSTFVFGWTVKDVLLESDANREMANLDFGYAQSKWVAEQLVYGAQRHGLPVRVYRPSLLSPATNGVGGRDDIAVRLVATMIRHGIAANARNQISFLPVDIAADNIAAIFGRRDLDGTTFHVTVDDYYSLIDVARTISRRYGYEFVYYEIPRFVEELNRRSTKDDPIYPLLDFFNRSHPKMAAMQHKRYDNSGYRAARSAAGGAGDAPALVDTVSYLMDFLVREEMIPDSKSTGRERFGASG